MNHWVTNRHNMRGMVSLAVLVLVLFAGQQRTAQAAVANCLAVEDAISDRMQKLQIVKDEHSKKYTKTAEDLQKLGNRLSLAGLDVKSFESNRKSFESKTKSFNESYNVYYQAVQDARAAACNESETVLKEKLAAARTLLGSVRESAEAVYKQYEEVLVKDVRALQ